MYKVETHKRLEGALCSILAQDGVLPSLSAIDSQEMAENLELLARVLADQLWFEGYQLTPRAFRPAVSVS